jgi:hypothetical protein
MVHLGRQDRRGRQVLQEPLDQLGLLVRLVLELLVQLGRLGLRVQLGRLDQKAQLDQLELQELQEKLVFLVRREQLVLVLLE